MNRRSAKRLAQGMAGLIPLAIFVLLDEFLLPSRFGWRTLAAFVTFTSGFVELLRVALDVRADNASRSSIRSAAIALSLVAVGSYFASTEQGGWRAVGAGGIFVLGIWAVGAVFPSDQLEGVDGEGTPEDPFRSVQADEQLRIRGPHM